MGEFRDKRKNALSMISAKFCHYALSVAYSVEVRNVDRLSDLSGQGFVLLPKHQSNLDIPLEGAMLINYAHRLAYYAMKGSLPSVLEWLGGIPVKRGKDIKIVSNRKQKRKLITEAKEQRNYMKTMIGSVLSSGGVIVIHPEGKRNWRKKGNVDRGLLNNLIKAQETFTETATYVPLDISFSGRSFGSEIIMEVGEPIRTGSVSELENHLVEQIDLLEIGE